MPIETINTPDAIITIETRVSGDGTGEARTVSAAPKPGTPIANHDDLRSKARAALSSNAAFLAIASPNNAQTAAQVKALTRQMNGVIRMLLGELTTTADT